MYSGAWVQSLVWPSFSGFAMSSPFLYVHLLTLVISLSCLSPSISCTSSWKQLPLYTQIGWHLLVLPTGDQPHLIMIDFDISVPVDYPDTQIEGFVGTEHGPPHGKRVPEVPAMSRNH